ncbi:ApbE-like lipoprotein [Candidatus Omnitrophus magneticus]|uniref:FAD:protein FMN transferase n=1 Tax=Candidatus Omnitrophus magneticus TaxID=1609969 RepID=A0A0F0CL75_9BACT|nr:ApbE-like lipoprotein [Candidatus Omnitrophus magneticus]
MGSFCDIIIDDKDFFSKNGYKGLEILGEEAFNIGEDLEKKFSFFLPSSELNKLNINKKVQASDEFISLIKESARAWQYTNGKFDITIASILKREGFYKSLPVDLLNSIPDTARKGVLQEIIIDEINKTIEIPQDAWLDCSGIAVGWAVDYMSDFLRSRGVNHFLINAGGDIYCAEKEGQGKWSIGIRKPGSDKISVTVNVENMAVITSGDYEKYVQDSEGNYISHIVDPYTGKSTKREFLGVTVIAPSAITADFLSTAMMAMGPSDAIKLAESLENVDLIFIKNINNKEEIYYSKGAKKYIGR